MFEQGFNVMSLKRARNLGVPLCQRKQFSRERKQRQDPFAKQEVATHCLGWCSARRIVEWFYRRWLSGEEAQGRRHLPGLWVGEGGKEPRLSCAVLEMRPRQAHSWPLLVCE